MSSAFQGFYCLFDKADTFLGPSDTKRYLSRDIEAYAAMFCFITDNSVQYFANLKYWVNKRELNKQLQLCNQI